MAPRSKRSRAPHLLSGAAIAAVVGLVASVPAGCGGVARAGGRGAKSNPLAGLRLGTFHSPTLVPNVDPPSAYFNTARSSRDRRQFARLLAVPRFRWFGANIPLYDQGYRSTYKPGAYTTARNYIETVQDGDPDTLVQLAIFRLTPFEKSACRRLPTRAEIRSYRLWINEFARGIRDSGARVVLVLQPDMPFTLCLPGGSDIDLRLVRESARTFTAIPRVTVYIDAGSSDWERAGRMTRMLRRVGIRSARGFALNLTHYASNRDEIRYGKRILADLARHGVRGKHFVVATGMNGRPFKAYVHRRTFRNGTLCRTRAQRACVTLGRPPTSQTGDPAVDAFLWASRPEYNNRTIRSYGELLQMLRTSPYF